jgi:hypothetical protein
VGIGLSIGHTVVYFSARRPWIEATTGGLQLQCWPFPKPHRPLLRGYLRRENLEEHKI